MIIIGLMCASQACISDAFLQRTAEDSESGGVCQERGELKLLLQIHSFRILAFNVPV